MSAAADERAAVLRVGPLEVWPPVVLAPMAGITNAPFRRLCRQFGADAASRARNAAADGTRPGNAERAEPSGVHRRHDGDPARTLERADSGSDCLSPPTADARAEGSNRLGPSMAEARPADSDRLGPPTADVRPGGGASTESSGAHGRQHGDLTNGSGSGAGGGRPGDGGLFVSEMITARGLAERNVKTLRMARFADDEPVRSIQLYGTDPRAIGAAARFLVGEQAADHIDLNFGCPVAKVTRKGGGAALPVHRALFRDIVRAAVQGAGEVPVTVKLRIGVDDRLPTFLDAGRIAQDEGAAAVALHARTAAQHYSGRADWGAIAALREVVTAVPLLGNGDIWQAADALRMMAETGCDGVVVGRGCLGRPWLFGDLALACAGLAVPSAPTLAEVVGVLRRHAHLLAEWLTEPVAVRDTRKHVGWYLQGYPVGGEARRRLTSTTTIAALDAELDRLAATDPGMTVLPGADVQPRGKTSGPISVALPERWLATADDPAPVVADDLDAVSGG